MMDLPFRQIHLDFHTSEMIPDIGAEFDPDEFGDTLVRAHVNSITCFARCHHGWNYYRSEKQIGNGWRSRTPPPLGFLRPDRY